MRPSLDFLTMWDGCIPRIDWHEHRIVVEMHGAYRFLLSIVGSRLQRLDGACV